MFPLDLWLLLTVIAGLLSNIFSFLNRYILKDNDDPTTYAWYTESLRFVVFGILALFNWKLILSPHAIVTLLSIGLAEFVGGYFYMKMHAYTHLSISSILSRTRLIWVPILGLLILHELLLPVDYLGILIIFLGVSLTIAPKKLFIDKGAMYANLSSFFIAGNTVLLKLAVPYASVDVINMFLAFPSTFLYPFFMKNIRVRMKSLFRTNLLLKTLATAIVIIQLSIFVFALNFGEASKINAVYQGMLGFSVLAGIVFLKERKDIGKKLVGAVITIIGVVILSLQ